MNYLTNWDIVELIAYGLFLYTLGVTCDCSGKQENICRMVCIFSMTLLCILVCMEK